MKYPQLVSPRAVNAISDWLVSRLEQLGVESPQIYTRLLLSLLQSSVQVNDPIEFSNLEAFFANRKGGHNKRYHLPSDTETLKKLNAVQCLREIVSNEQETAAIENLVDELCEKLKDIETRTQELNDEECFLNDTTLNIESLPTTTTGRSSCNYQLQQQRGTFNPQQQHLCPSSSSHVIAATGVNDHARRHENPLNDIDNDPKKRYFRAFPALSKEMEDSFRIWRRNAKSLTWPVVGRSIVANNNSHTINTLASRSASSSISSSSNFDGNLSVNKVVEKNLKAGRLEEFNSHKFRALVDIGGAGAIANSDGDVQGAAGAAANAKKKTKRRRNQALCKGKPIQNLRKTTLGANPSNSCGASVGKFHNQTHYYRNSSPTWDTDFKGCWEMGPDLIKEFLARQKGTNKRSRSNSDSMDHEERNHYKMLNEMAKADGLLSGKERSLNFDISFCCDDDERHDAVDYVDEDYDDDTLTSLTAASDGNNARRLYQREGNLQKPMVVFNVVEDDNDNFNEQSTDSVDQLDFDSLKAKFDSNVEALWKDAETSATSSTITSSSTQNEAVQSNNNPIGISSAFYANTSLNALAPFKQDLWNFWSNYNQYDQLATKFSTATASTSSMITTRLDDSSASSGAGADIANSSDYFSMPSNLDDFDKSVGALRRVNEAGASLGAHTPSISVFLQNSIWSSSGDCVDAVGAAVADAAGETDESFLYKVWHSNKKLSQIDVGNKKEEKISSSMISDVDSTTVCFDKPKELLAAAANGAKLQFPPYNSLKWSEGINAGPPSSNLRTASSNLESLNKSESKYAGFCATATTTGANWDAPAFGQNTQPDLQSWCASNPMSLTEMYGGGNDVCDSITQEEAAAAADDADIVEVDGPEVTLPNHCANTSGFIAYARIKQSGLIWPQTKPLQQLAANVTSPEIAWTEDVVWADEVENLLTSERTHFHPIENFVDGHTFDISSALDGIEFERSASGYLSYESNEYLEYTRSDVCMPDEEATNTNLLNFAAAAAADGNGQGAAALVKSKSECNEKFVLKFRLNRACEIACQTEEIDFQLAAAKMLECHALEQIVMPPYSNASLPLTRQANNEAILAAVSKAVAAATKAAAEQGLNAGHHSSLSWIPATRSDCNYAWLQDVSLSDEVDFCKTNANAAEQLNKYWCMQEIEKQCHQRRLPLPFALSHMEDGEHLASTTNYQATFSGGAQLTPVYRQLGDMDRCGDDSSLDNSAHTLWGMCAVCNSCDYGKSLPANRLLRDELKMEADEIMSDLRYMQDLYIGEADSVADNAVNDNVDRNSEIFNELGDDDEANAEEKTETLVAGNVQATMLLKVNQLIEDLLRPEQTGKMNLVQQQQVNDVEQSNRQSLESNSACGGGGVGGDNAWAMHTDDDAVDNSHSWHYRNEQLNNIWQHETTQLEQVVSDDAERKNVFMQPMKLLKQVGGSFNEEDLYMDKLNWEHENLAKIWQTTETSPILAKSLDITLENVQTAQCAPLHSLATEDEQIVQKKNLKNLQNIASPTISATAAASSTSVGPTPVTYKRVQQFLNTSAAKIKLANRKRRHSASQNFYHHQQQQQNQQHNNNNNNRCSSHNINNNNNNNDYIADLNRFKFNSAEASGSNSTNITKAEELPETTQEPKQTIITCKYWTTSTNGTQASLITAAAAMMQLAAASNKADEEDINAEDNTEHVMLDETTFGNTFSCLIDKNASILKHVTMMTRPLTR